MKKNLIILISLLIIILVILTLARVFNTTKQKPIPKPSAKTQIIYKTLPTPSPGIPEQIDPEIYTTNKWINSLPIANEKYYIDVKIEYMATDSAILATIYTKAGDEITIKNEVLGKLGEIGVDLSREKIIWQVK